MPTALIPPPYRGPTRMLEAEAPVEVTLLGRELPLADLVVIPRVLIDELLAGRRPAGFAYEPRSHYAVAAAFAQGRADWGVAIETVAREQCLRFQPLRAEHYDFAVPAARWEKPGVRALRRLLEPGSMLRAELAGLGFGAPEDTPGAART